MMDSAPISPNGPAPLAGSQPGVRHAGKSDGTGFKDMLKQHLDEVNDLQFEADKAVRDLVTGSTDNIHQVLSAITEADLSFRLMMQVRNKLVEAYKEIMRMQV
jgi:flagellar hook-basal body complex protein FliE